MAQRPTIASVADAAGVSRQTVSNALNAPERVGPDTLARVMSTIAQLGYRPSGAARQMRTGRSHLLALRIESARDGVNGSIGDRFLHALAESAKAAGYRILLCTAEDDESELAEYDELHATKDLDGVILTATRHADPRRARLAQAGLAYVSFGRPWELTATGSSITDGHWVDVDGAAGTRAATAHLASLGHRRIGFLGWPSPSEVGDDRRSGWAGAMAELLPDAPAADATSVDEVDAGRAAASVLLDGAAPTAIVCGSDTLAIAAAAEVARRGLRVGADVSIVGFDDTPAARALGLASLRQPLDEVADQCVAGLLRQFRGATGTTGRLLQPSLVLRPSVQPPRHSEG